MMLINFASAQFYGRFSLSDFLNSVDESWIVLGMIFLIVYALVSYGLGNFFKGNKAVSGSIAFAIALLVIWGVNRSGFNYNGLFYNFFFFLPTGFVETIWPILFLGFGVFLVIKTGNLGKGLGILFIGSGVLLIFLSFIGVIYETEGGGSLGFGLIIIGVLSWWLGTRKWGGKKQSHYPDSSVT